MVIFDMYFVSNSKMKPSVPESMLKKKKQRDEFLRKQAKSLALLKKVFMLFTAFPHGLHYV